MREPILERRIAAARDELSDALNPSAPDLTRVATRSRSRRRAFAVGATAIALVVTGITVITRGGVDPSNTVIAGPGPSTSATRPLSAVDWSSLDYPVDCEGSQTIASVVAYPSPQPGTQLAVVSVSCAAGAGSPPSAVLVYDGADSATSAHLRQTLLTYQDDWSPVPGGAIADGPNLAIRVSGYSTYDVPRCCPDLHPTLTWTWNGDEYGATKTPPAHTRLPRPD